MRVAGQSGLSRSVLQGWVFVLLFTAVHAQEGRVQLPSLAQCREWLQSDSIDFRLLAVDQAMKHQGDRRQEVCALLHLALRDRQSVVRIVAARSIQRLKDKSSIVPLTKALEEDDALIDHNYGGVFAGSIPPHVRINWRGEVIDALSEYGADAAAALPLVRRYIIAGSSPTCNAITFIGRLRDRASVGLLIPFVTGEIKTVDDEIACAAVALGRIGDPQAVPMLEKCALQTNQPFVRDAALKAVVDIRSANSSPK